MNNEIIQIQIAGEEVTLPLVTPTNTPFYSFNLLGKAELNRRIAKELHQKMLNIIDPIDTIVTVEAKAIGLAQSLCEQMGIERCVVLRKEKKSYMKNPIHVIGASITSGINQYWLDEEDASYLQGKRVAFLDDVISTGGTARAAIELMKSIKVPLLYLCCAATEGTKYEMIDRLPIISCGHIPSPILGKE